MQIQIKHFPGTYPSFNVLLANEGKEPFIEIKGCKIMNGTNGEFVSWPSRKKDDGTYWNHIYASNDFNAAVLQKAKAGRGNVQPPRPPPRAASAGAGFADDFDTVLPF